MTFGSKEYYEIIKDFENFMKKISSIRGSFEKESKELQMKGVYYCNGEINNAFKIYQAGYANGRLNYM